MNNFLHRRHLISVVSFPATPRDDLPRQASTTASVSPPTPFPGLFFHPPRRPGLRPNPLLSLSSSGPSGPSPCRPRGLSCNLQHSFSFSHKLYLSPRSLPSFAIFYVAAIFQPHTPFFSFRLVLLAGLHTTRRQRPYSVACGSNLSQIVLR